MHTIWFEKNAYILKGIISRGIRLRVPNAARLRGSSLRWPAIPKGHGDDEFVSMEVHGLGLTCELVRDGLQPLPNLLLGVDLTFQVSVQDSFDTVPDLERVEY